MTITFQKESFLKLMPELPPLFYEHWKEVALDKKVIALDPDWERYLAMEQQNMLHIMTVRDEGILIGYYIAIVLTHLHYKQSLTAFSDIFYVLPEYRKTGFGILNTGYWLFRYSEKMLKKIGVQKSYVMTKAHLPINMLMKRLKYRLVERTFTKLL